MINFMRLLSHDIVPIWSNTYLDAAVKVLLDVINM